MISLLFAALVTLGTPSTTSTEGVWTIGPCPRGAHCPKYVYSLTYKMCHTDAYTDGKDRTTCDWDKETYGWVFDTKALCDQQGKRELYVNYGDWRTLDHKRLWAVKYRCNPLTVMTAKDVRP